MAKVLVATIRSWNARLYREWAARCAHTSRLIQDAAELSLERVAGFGPDLIVFPHWSWRIPPEIFTRYECIVFHMTDLPFGRGGSPLQNLIARGMEKTQVSAIRVVEEMDAGPVYLKRPLCLHGSATEIYLRAARLVYEMLDAILVRRPVPQPQMGEVVQFRRRAPAESGIPATLSLEQLYDFIRMLDAEGYPQAFLEHEGFRYEFRRAGLYDGRILADVQITPIPKEPA